MVVDKSHFQTMTKMEKKRVIFLTFPVFSEFSCRYVFLHNIKLYEKNGAFCCFSENSNFLQILNT
jgi:hypothetical protein